MARSSDSFFLLALLKDKTFQAREIRRVIAFASLYLLLTTALLGVFYYQMLGQLVSGSSPMLFVSEDMNMLNEQVPGLAEVLGRWVLYMLVINIVVTSVISVYIIRKLGHPLLAVKRALREIGAGKLNVRLRASDSEEFADIADALQSAVQQINRKIAEAKNQINTLHDMQQPAANTEELEEAVTNCKIALDYFETQVPPSSNDNGRAAA
jgi:methyl-accepting chemotaxis protein